MIEHDCLTCKKHLSLGMAVGVTETGEFRLCLSKELVTELSNFNDDENTSVLSLKSKRALNDLEALTVDMIDAISRARKIKNE